MNQLANIDRLRRHVTEICDLQEIEIEWQEKHDGRSLGPQMRIIQVRPIKSAVTYAVALHEIGHVLGTHQGSRRKAVRERWAWRWAKRNALVWTPKMERTMRDCIEWYEATKWPPEPTFRELNPRLFGEDFS
jgi:hypothetical protein